MRPDCLQMPVPAPWALCPTTMDTVERSEPHGAAVDSVRGKSWIVNAGTTGTGEAGTLPAAITGTERAAPVAAVVPDRVRQDG